MLEHLWRSFWHDTTKQSAERRSAQICLDTEVWLALGLSAVQTTLLQKHLAAEIVLKKGHQDSYLAQKPEVNAVREIPFLGVIVNALVFIPNEVNEGVVRELRRETEKEIEAVKNRFTDALIRNAAKQKGLRLQDADVGSLRESIEADIPGLDTAIKSGLRSRGIQRAANLLAAVYVAHKNNSQEVRLPALKSVVQRISTWDEFTFPV